MRRDPSKQRLKAFLLAWCIVWFGTWLVLSVAAFRAHGRPEPSFALLYRTVAFVAGWAGAFALRGIDRRR
ncbi:MAG TPA: hypothetical protein VGM37_02390 [Armatimonadota bacterium]|jgi:hypothetical protein